MCDSACFVVIGANIWRGSRTAAGRRASDSGDIVLQNDFARLTLGGDGRVHGFARRDGTNLLAAAAAAP